MTSTKLGLFLTPHVTIEWQFIQSKSTNPHSPFLRDVINECSLTDGLSCLTTTKKIQRQSNTFQFFGCKKNISQFWSNKMGFPHWSGCNALIPMTSNLPCKRLKTKNKLIYRKTFVERDICSKNATLIGHKLKNWDWCATNLQFYS